MPVGVDVQVAGTDRLARELSHLSSDVRRKLHRQSLEKASRHIVRQAKGSIMSDRAEMFRNVMTSAPEKPDDIPAPIIRKRGLSFRVFDRGVRPSAHVKLSNRLLSGGPADRRIRGILGKAGWYSKQGTLRGWIENRKEPSIEDFNRVQKDEVVEIYQEAIESRIRQWRK